MVNETSSPSTLPSSIVDLPKRLLVVSPVSLWPSTLKTKVLSTVPLGVSALPFQLPLISAARAVPANSANKANIFFIAFLLLFLGLTGVLEQETEGFLGLDMRSDTAQGPILFKTQAHGGKWFP